MDIQTISHRIQSPVAEIRSLLQTIKEGSTEETNKKALYIIERAISRAEEAEELITDLLNYELYSEGGLPQKREFDLIALLNDLVSQYFPVASEKGISLYLGMPRNLRLLMIGDPRGMEHAIRNLLENGIKYTPPQGSVSIVLTILEEDKKCRLQISDTGYGIKKDELENIFKPFYRSILHKSNIPGTGLGLSIVKQIVTNHDGTINVESEEKEGTTFTVILPYIRVLKGEMERGGRKRVIIVGGVTAGPKVAARLRRLDEDADITIIEKGEFLSYSGCGLPDFISGKVSSPVELMSPSDATIRNIQFFSSIKNITSLNNTIVEGIDREEKVVKTRNFKTGARSKFPYDVLVLATGAVPRIPDIPGIDDPEIYTLNNIEDARRIKASLSAQNAKDVFVIGGGLIGISLAQALVEMGTRVTILEIEPFILKTLMDGDIAVKIQNELNKKGIKIVTGAEIVKFQRADNHLRILIRDTYLQADLVILCTGVKPNNSLAVRAGLELGEYGGIKVNKYLLTSDENIYAIGDCTEKVNIVTGKTEYWPLGSISIKMGRIAADNIAGRKTEFKGSLGTTMLKIFDINVARTGLTMEAARSAGYRAESVVVCGLDRAHYYPNAEYIFLKVIADRETRRLLGAQGYGRGEVISRIDTLATEITHSSTLEDIFKTDLGYAPAFKTPIDIAQAACLVLNNKIEGLFQTITPQEIEQEGEETHVVSVCSHKEHSTYSIPGSINIPLENIRREGVPFDKNEKLILYSKTSAGAYEASMYLSRRGYTDVYVLEGGYLFWEK